MTLLNKSTVPIYLQSGELFRSLGDEDGSFEVPNAVTKLNDEVNSKVDAIFLLESLKYWVADSIPITIIVFCINSLENEEVSYISEYGNFFPVLEALTDVLSVSKYSQMAKALSHGYVDIVKVLYHRVPFPSSACMLAAKARSLPCLQYAHEKGCSLHIVSELSLISTAATSNSLECVTYVHEQGLPIEAGDLQCIVQRSGADVLRYAHLTAGCDLDAFLVAVAARAGNTAALQYLCDSGLAADSTTLHQAIQSKQLSCVQLLLARGVRGAAGDCSFTAEAAQWATPDALLALREHGFPWNATACAAAATTGSMTCLCFLHEQSCPWDNTAVQEAGRAANLPMLQYMHAQKYPWDAGSLYSVAGIPKQNGCVKFLCEIGCPMNSRCTYMYAYHGDLDMLKYLYEHGCPWDAKTVQNSMSYGHLDCLIYLHEHGCPWDETACATAARYDFIHCLRYLHEHGCPWNSGTLEQALEHECPRCLRYADQRGCPWSEEADDLADYVNEPRCVAYLEERQLRLAREAGQVQVAVPEGTQVVSAEALASQQSEVDSSAPTGRLAGQAVGE